VKILLAGAFAAYIRRSVKVHEPALNLQLVVPLHLLHDIPDLTDLSGKMVAVTLISVGSAFDWQTLYWHFSRRNDTRLFAKSRIVTWIGLIF
jgi:hypothetical protein